MDWTRCSETWFSIEIPSDWFLVRRAADGLAARSSEQEARAVTIVVSASEVEPVDDEDAFFVVQRVNLAGTLPEYQEIDCERSVDTPLRQVVLSSFAAGDVAMTVRQAQVIFGRMFLTATAVAENVQFVDSADTIDRIVGSLTTEADD